MMYAKNVVSMFIYIVIFEKKIIPRHSSMIPKATNKKAKCIKDGDENSASYYFCVCPEGFGGDPHKECKPEIVKEPCEKCG